MKETVYDITILGGGPTGLFAAFYAGLRNASCKIIDSMPTLGGRLTAVYPEKHIYDVAGFPKITAKDLVDNLIEQIKPYKTDICLEESAEEIYKDADDNWIIKTDKQSHKTKTIIIASGVGIYTPKKHQAHGAKEFENNGISYAVIKKSDYKGKKIAILGGGDSALDWVHELSEIAKEVTLIHRSEKFRAHDDSVNKLKHSRASVLLNTEVTEFLGSDLGLRAIRIKNLIDESEDILSVDDAIIMFGYNSSLGKMKTWGLETEKDSILVNERMETNLPGIFAAGDVTDHSAKLKLIATGFSEAAIAVAFAKVYMNPKEKAQPLHSTTIMELKEKKNRSQSN